MKLKKEEKGAIVSELREKFTNAKAVVFTNYKGMTVKELEDLRGTVRNAGIEYKIVKNTLARIAAKDTSMTVSDEVFKGPVGIAFGYNDPVLVAKKITEFAKKNDKIKVSSAIIEGRFCNAGDIKTIAELPPREALLSILAGALQAPLGKMASALSATVSSFAYALNALKTKKSAS